MGGRFSRPSSPHGSRSSHPDVEVLIASRPVALADAATRDLPSLLMKKPEAPERTADAILRAAAEEEIAEDHREVWVAERESG